MTVEFSGDVGAAIRNLRATSPNYRVGLSIIDNSEAAHSVTSSGADIYWVDLGMSFKEAADGAATNTGIQAGPNYENSISEIPQTITSQRGTDWYIGYHPEGRILNSTGNNGGFDNLTVDNAKINYSISSNNIKLTGSSDSSFLKSQENNVALMQSSKIGQIELIGKFSADAADLQNVKFSYTRILPNGTTTTERRDNIGRRRSSTVGNTGMSLKMNWTGIGAPYSDFIADTNRVTDPAKTNIKLCVKDGGNVGYGKRNVVLVLTEKGSNDVIVQYTVQTDENGEALIDSETLKDTLTAIGGGDYTIKVVGVQGFGQNDITYGILSFTYAPDQGAGAAEDSGSALNEETVLENGQLENNSPNEEINP